MLINRNAIVLLILLSVVMISCARRFNYPEAQLRNEIKFEDEKMVEEVLFMMELKSATEFLVKGSEEAIQKAYSVYARDFAETVQSELQWTIRDFEFLFAKVRIKRPYTMSGDHTARLIQLRGNTPQRFDQVYFDEVSKTLDWAVSRMEVYAQDAEHKRIRSFCFEKQEKYQRLLDQVHERQAKLLSVNP